MEGVEVSEASGTSPSFLAKLLISARYVTAWGLVLLLLAGITGQIARDRNILLGLMLYLPTVLVGLTAVGFDLALRGRALRRPQFGLAALGLAATLLAGAPMLGGSLRGGASPSDRDVVLLHWNVMWGGGPWVSPATWQAQRQNLVRLGRDVIVLSEAPYDPSWVDRLRDDLGPGWQMARAINEPGYPYWLNLAVLARGTVKMDGLTILPNGSAADFRIGIDGQDLRLLVVDGRSDPLASRSPFLEMVAEMCRRAEAEGRPFHAVVGDFNAPACCRGFDLLAEQGYQLASRGGSGGPRWRATFPSILPLLDIDHVWLSPGCDLVSDHIFHGPWSDHLGQVVRFSAARRRSGLAGPVSSGS